jgi:hypothetical protein
MNTKEFDKQRGVMKWISGFLPMAVLFLSLLGCGGEKERGYRAKLSEAGGLSAGHEVVWRGMPVGQVTSVGLEDGSILAAFELKPEHRGKLYADVSARVSSGFLGQGQPRLELFGAATPAAGPLTPGIIIPEAGRLQALNREHLVWAAVACVGALLVLFLLRGFSWLIRLAFTVLVLGAAGMFVKLQWDRYKHHVVSPETEAAIMDKAYQVLGNPKAQAAWQAILEDASSIYQMSADVAGKASGEAGSLLVEQLEGKIKGLQASGDSAAADDLLRLKDYVDELRTNP